MTMERGPRAALVEMRCTVVRWERPPLKHLILDVTFRNPEPEPRWFVLPKATGAQTAAGGITGGDAAEIRNGGGVLLFVFRGTGGFQAVRLPPDGEVRISGLPLAFWGDLPQGAVPLRVIISRDVRIGGTAVEEWIGKSAIYDRRAAVRFAERRTVVSRETPDGKEQPVEYVAPREIVVEVGLPREE